VLARALEGPDGDNRDLAALAVVGAVGDMQDSDGGLIGANEAIVADGVDAGVIETRTDLDLYGRQTRPLPKLLEYASDVKIPGVSNDEAGAISFLTDLDIEVKRDGEWRRWVDLDAGERQILASGLMRRAVASGVPADRIEALVGTSYTLVDEEPGTELRDVSEFSTLSTPPPGMNGPTWDSRCVSATGVTHSPRRAGSSGTTERTSLRGFSG